MGGNGVILDVYHLRFCCIRYDYVLERKEEIMAKLIGKINPKYSSPMCNPSRLYIRPELVLFYNALLLGIKVISPLNVSSTDVPVPS